MPLCDNLVHFGGGERSACGRVDISRRSQMQQQRGRRLVISGFKDQHAVVIAQGPVDVRDFDAHLLGRCLDRRRSFRGFVNSLDSLLSELDGLLLRWCRFADHRSEFFAQD